jgi:hypothetical protein
MTPREWAHFIGEEQYTVESFIAEAEKYEISRNIPAQQLKGIQYGDTINLMQWDGNQAILFAQFVVRRVFIRNPEISAAVAEKRACGSYVTGPGIVVDDEKTSIREIIDLAEEIASQTGEEGEKKIKWMVGGSLSHKFPEPIPLGKYGPQFSRGFIRFNTGLDIHSLPDFSQSREMVAASNYRPAKQRSRSKQDAT